VGRPICGAVGVVQAWQQGHVSMQGPLLELSEAVDTLSEAVVSLRTVGMLVFKGMLVCKGMLVYKGLCWSDIPYLRLWSH